MNVNECNDKTAKIAGISKIKVFTHFNTKNNITRVIAVA